MEESQAKLGYIKDLHRAYENWLSYENFPALDDDAPTTTDAAGRKPKLKIIDANLDEETIEHHVHSVIEKLLKKY